MASRAVKIVDGGKLVIPASVRHELGIAVDDTVMVDFDADGLHIRTLSSAVKAAQDIVREFSLDETRLSDALIADRRLAAARE